MIFVKNRHFSPGVKDRQAKIADTGTTGTTDLFRKIKSLNVFTAGTPCSNLKHESKNMNFEGRIT